MRVNGRPIDQSTQDFIYNLRIFLVERVKIGQVFLCCLNSVNNYCTELFIKSILKVKIVCTISTFCHVTFTHFFYVMGPFPNVQHVQLQITENCVLVLLYYQSLNKTKSRADITWTEKPHFFLCSICPEGQEAMESLSLIIRGLSHCSPIFIQFDGLVPPQKI